MKTVGPLMIGVFLVLGVGAVHGVYTDRWGPSGQLQQAVAVLDRLPPALGDWTSEEVGLEAETMARAGIRGCVYRKYTNPRTREVVSVLVVCGRGGPISVHTPDVCYAGNGYEQVSPATVRDVPVGDAGHTFRAARFARPGGLSQGRLEVLWAWSLDGRTWQAPDNPRVSFARAPALYKFYVVREFLPGTRAESADVCRDFLARAIPEFRAVLSPAD